MPKINKDDFKIVIGDFDVTPLIKSFKIESHLYGSCASFEAELYPVFDMDIVKRAYPYHIYINKQIVQNGFIDEFSVKMDVAEGTKKKIWGRDSLQILTDNDCMFDIIFTKKTINGIWSQLLYGKNGAYASAKVKDVKLKSSFNKNQSIIAKKFVDTVIDAHGIETSIPSELVVARNENYSPLSTEEQSNFPVGNFGKIMPLQYSAEAAAQLKLGKPNEYQYRDPKPQFGETWFSFMTKLLNQLGLIIRALPTTDNNIYYFIDTYLNAVVENEDGSPLNGPKINNYTNSKYRKLNNIISMDYTESVRDFYQFVKMIGNTTHEEDSISTLPGGNTDSISTLPGGNADTHNSHLKIEALAFYDDPGSTITTININSLPFKGLAKFKSTNSESVDINTWTLHADKLINNVMITQVRNLYKLKYKVPDFSKLGSMQVYRINELASVDDDTLSLGIDSGLMLVSDIEMNYSFEGGATTEITLHNYNVFTGDGLRNTNLVGYDRPHFSPGLPGDNVDYKYYNPTVIQGI